MPVAEAERLAHYEPDEAPADQPAGDEMLQSLLARTARHRRDRTWRGLAAAAAIVLVAGSAGAVGWDVLHPAASGTGQHASAAAPHWQTVSGTDRATLTSIRVRFAPTSWGTAMNVQVRGIPAGTNCQFQVTDSAGHRSIVGGWTTDLRRQLVLVPGGTSIPVKDIRSFQITTGSKVLVSVPAQ